MYKKFVIGICIIFLFSLVFFHKAIYADGIATDSANFSSQPTTTPTLLPDNQIAATDSAITQNDITNSSNTGENLETNQATVSAENTTTNINTGSSISTTTVTNTVNTQLINSHIYFQTINIFLDTNDSLDLSQTISVAENAAMTTQNPTTNIFMSNITTHTVVNNVIDTSADTGDNTVAGNNVVINTGNAYAIVQLLNTVNVTLVNTDMHIVTINIYGNMRGNIILPDIPNNPTTCTSVVNETNVANITSAIINTANTGNNTITASVSGTLTTGNTSSQINTTNFINTMILGGLFQHVTINTFGIWQGNFLGLRGTETENLNLKDISPILASNSADITNIITNSANSGNNNALGDDSLVTTGNAYAYVNLLNFINSIFVQSTGYLGFINIFGSLTGDIGSVNYFITPTPTPIVTLSNTLLSSQDSDVLGAQIFPKTSPYPTYIFTFKKATKETRKAPTTSKIKTAFIRISSQQKNKSLNMYILGGISMLFGIFIFGEYFLVNYLC